MPKKCKNCSQLLYKTEKYCSSYCMYEYRKQFGFYGGAKGGKRAAMINKKNKTGFFNSNLQSSLAKRVSHDECVKKGRLGSYAVNKLRFKKHHVFNRINFDSKREMEIGMCIHYQIEKIKEGENYQIKVDVKQFDFFINNLFIEVHPFDFYGNTKLEYYLKRRKALNDNGYRGYPLMIIT